MRLAIADHRLSKGDAKRATKLDRTDYARFQPIQPRCCHGYGMKHISPRSAESTSHPRTVAEVVRVVLGSLELNRKLIDFGGKDEVVE